MDFSDSHENNSSSEYTTLVDVPRLNAELSNLFHFGKVTWVRRAAIYLMDETRTTDWTQLGIDEMSNYFFELDGKKSLLVLAEEMKDIADRNLGKVSDKDLRGLVELTKEVHRPTIDVVDVDSMLARYGGYVDGLYLSF